MTLKVEQVRKLFNEAIAEAESDQAIAGMKAFIEGMDDFGSDDEMDLAQALAVFAEDVRDQSKE